MAAWTGLRATGRRRMLGVAVGALALGILGAAALLVARDPPEDPATRPAEARPEASDASEPTPLPTGNLRVLTRAESERLVRYARDLATCLDTRGVDSAGPTIQRRLIALETAERVGLRRLAVLSTACAERLGDPPSGSSLQAVDASTVVLSLPKQCLLDPKL